MGSFCWEVPAAMRKYLRAVLPIALLGLIGAGNIIPIKVFFGFEWLWGSIALLVLIRYWGMPAGILGSIVASCSAVLGGYSPYSPLIYLFEGLFLTYAWRRTKHSILSLTVFYWMVIGSLVALSYLLGGKAPTQPALVFIILRMLVNGSVNAVVAEVIIVLSDCHRTWGNRRLPSLRRVFSISSMAFLCISTLLLVSFESWYEFRAVESEIRSDLRISHSAISTAVQNELITLTQTMTYLAEKLGSGSFSTADIQRDIELIDKASHGLLGLYVADSEARSIGFSPAFGSSGELNVGRSFAHREYYQELIRTKRPITSELILTDSLSSTGQPTPVVVIAFPVINGGELYGYAAGLLDLAFAEGLLRSFSQDDSEITLLDEHHRVIASTNPENVPGGQLQYSGPRGFHHRLEGSIEHHMEADGSLPILEQWRRSYYVLEEPILTNQLGVEVPWTLVVERPIAADIDRLYGFYNYGLAMLLMLLAAAAVIARLGAYWFGTPIRMLANLSDDLPGKIRKGEQIAWPLPRITEQDVLISNYRKMTEAINEYVRELNLYSRRMEYLAERDPLTGLFNRTVLPRRLKNAIDLARIRKSRVAVMFVDLDDFKSVNDTYGHDAGDALLVEIGSRFLEYAGDMGSVIRQGGDEFVVVLESVSGKDDVKSFVDRLFAALSLPIDIGSGEITVTASIGISLFPEHGDSVNTLLRKADTAMYSAKEVQGNSFRFYEKQMDTAFQDQLKLTDELDRAISREELQLHFQPIVDCGSQTVQGVEALVRWQHPQRGAILPGQFLPAAEQCGLILDIDEWVLQAACTQVLNHFGKREHPMLFVNLSGQHLHPGSGLVDMVAGVLDSTKFDPKSLVLEITETTLIENVGSATSILMELRKLGIRIALDDFGEGYSSLAYLANLPVDILKISGQFAYGISQHARDVAVIDTVIGMAKRLDIVVVVEGIELANQMEFFAQRGCDLAQGFYLGEPRPIYELTGTKNIA